MTTSSIKTRTEPKPLEGFVLLAASVALAAAVFMQVLDTTIANVCVPYIAGDLAVSKTNATWVITMFAAGNSIVLPLTGWLTKRFGNVRVMIGSTLAFTLMSWLCGVSPTFNFLVIARFFQGASAGPLIPLSQSLMIMAYPEKSKNLAIAIWTMVALVGPIAGPILGGWIVLNYTWHWIFLINIPVGFLAAFLMKMLLMRYESETSHGRVDYIGFIFLAVGVTTLQIMLDKGQQYDWWSSSLIVGLTIAAVLSFLALFFWEKTDENPLIDLSLFSDANFTLGTFLTAASYVLLFGSIVISPLWLQTTMGYDAFWAGVATSTMGIFPILFVRYVAHLLDIYEPRYILMVCFLTLSGAYFYFYHFTPQVSLEIVAFSRFLFGIPIAFWLPSLSALTFAHIAKDKLPMATGVFHFIRMMSGGIGASLIVTLWERRSAFHQSVLVSTITPFDTEAHQATTELIETGFSSHQSIAMLYQEVLRQSLQLATNDVFYLSCLLSLGYVFVSYFFKSKDAIYEVSSSK